MALAIGSVFLLLRHCFKQIHEKGLINYFPPKLQNFLLNRSIFDVLCDLWFIPKVGLYLKAFFGPFYYESNPEKALNAFEIIGLTRAVTVKGFINLFPGIKKMMLPASMPKSPIKKPKVETEDGFASDSSSQDSSSVISEEEKQDVFEGKDDKKQGTDTFVFNNYQIKNTSFVRFFQKIPII